MFNVASHPGNVHDSKQGITLGSRRPIKTTKEILLKTASQREGQTQKEDLLKIQTPVEKGENHMAKEFSEFSGKLRTAVCRERLRDATARYNHETYKKPAMKINKTQSSLYIL